MLRREGMPSPDDCVRSAVHLRLAARSAISQGRLSGALCSGMVQRSSTMRSDVLSPSRVLRSLAILVIIAASAADPPLAAAEPPVASAPSVRVLAAWVRWLPAGLPAAGYLTLVNTGDKPLSLERASSASYGDVSIHRSITHGTNVQMTPVKEITIAAHSTLEFESQGYHLMLMQPTASAAAGQVPVTLYFSDGSSLVVPFEIRRTPAGGSQRP